MVIKDFTVTRIPFITFGPARINEIAQIARQFGRNVLLIIGGNSFKKSGKFDSIVDNLKKNSFKVFEFSVYHEPSPELVDKAIQTFKNKKIDLVISIGGGSVIDAGKAISALFSSGETVIDYLEGVGKGKIYTGKKLPFIAVPTTAGTGSEVTKNAVLSKPGTDGFKKSFRHDSLVPEAVIIDPELALSCPPEVTAQCGMDALSQLIESYVSSRASPITDALAFNGIRYIKECLIPVCSRESGNIKMRTGMAYAALVSGITLTNAGLGIVHGLASAIGGYFNIPHGIVCGTLLAPAFEINIKKLRKRRTPEAKASLEKHAELEKLLSGRDRHDRDKNCNLLIKILYDWTEALNIPGLNEYGIKEQDIDRIISSTGQKNNPVILKRDDIKKILRYRV